MAVHFSSSNPRELLRQFDAAVQAVEGAAQVWKKADTEQSYTLASARWGARAWLKPDVLPIILTFNIVVPAGGSHVSSAMYSLYHARLVHSFLSHHAHLFSMVGVTAAPTAGDQCSN